jgi:hypothetical protein
VVASCLKSESVGSLLSAKLLVRILVKGFLYEPFQLPHAHYLLLQPLQLADRSLGQFLAQSSASQRLAQAEILRQPESELEWAAFELLVSKEEEPQQGASSRKVVQAINLKGSLLPGEPNAEFHKRSV